MNLEHARDLIESLGQEIANEKEVMERGRGKQQGYVDRASKADDVTEARELLEDIKKYTLMLDQIETQI